jgi:hypothetical protein
LIHRGRSAGSALGRSVTDLATSAGKIFLDTARDRIARPFLDGIYLGLDASLEEGLCRTTPQTSRGRPCACSKDRGWGAFR